MAMIKFECGREDRWTEGFGPYEYVQITYDELRAEVNDDVVTLAYYNGDWIVTDQIPELEGQYFSDIIVW